MRAKILLPQFPFTAFQLLLTQYLQHNLLCLLLIQSKLAADFLNHHLILSQIKIAIDQLPAEILLKLFTALIVALFLAVPYLQKQSKSSFSRAKKRGQKEAIGQ